MIIQLACRKVFGSFVMSNRRTVSDKLRRLLRPDQINCLFHGSGGSILLRRSQLLTDLLEVESYH